MVGRPVWHSVKALTGSAVKGLKPSSHTVSADECPKCRRTQDK